MNFHNNCELRGVNNQCIKTNIIGQLIMEALMHLDQVAYVRFASVYKNFREAKDFEDFLGNLEDK